MATSANSEKHVGKHGLYSFVINCYFSQMNFLSFLKSLCPSETTIFSFIEHYK